MEIKTIAFVFGVILLATGILGGGFQLKELNVPKVSWLPRFFATVVGTFFILLGVGLDSPSTTQPDPSPPVNPSRTIEFMVSDALAENQISEQVSILINGKFVGNLTVNQDFPNATLRVTVPEAGTYTYTADALATFATSTGPVAMSGAGQGNISVKAGSHFDVIGSMSGSTWFISLQERE